jgi:hypothetical protein
VNNLADPFYHNGWSHYVPLRDGEKLIIMRSADTAPIREIFWKNTGRLVNNFSRTFLGTAIVRSLSVSLIRRVDLVSRKQGLSLELRIELHHRLTDLILFLHA